MNNNNLKDLYARLKFYDKSIATNNRTIKKIQNTSNPEEMHLLKSLQDANKTLEQHKASDMQQFTMHVAQMSTLPF